MTHIFFRVKGTVIIKIWWQVFLVALYSAAAVCILKFGFQWNPDLPLNLKIGRFQKESTIAIFGLFTGFLLVFRTNTAYDRYWAGTKLWSSMTLNIRTLTRLIWTMVSTNDVGENSENHALVEKVSVINLLIGFAYATRNYLRDDHSYENTTDLRKLLAHVPKIFKNRFCLDSDQNMPPRNIPVEISHLIMGYLRKLRQENLIDDPINLTMHNALNSLVECVSALEIIVKTPLPMAYVVHLQHAIWLYFLALPYQLYEALDWFTIPVVALAAFTILGILDISGEIKNPFGYDDNDLPLDDFCRTIHQEVLEIIRHPMPPAEVWIFSNGNHPLMPKCYLPARELVKLSEDEIRELLARFKRQNSFIFTKL